MQGQPLEPDKWSTSTAHVNQELICTMTPCATLEILLSRTPTLVTTETSVQSTMTRLCSRWICRRMCTCRSSPSFSLTDLNSKLKTCQNELLHWTLMAPPLARFWSSLAKKKSSLTVKSKLFYKRQFMKSRVLKFPTTRNWPQLE